MEESKIEEIEVRGSTCLLCGSQWYLRYDAGTESILVNFGLVSRYHRQSRKKAAPLAGRQIKT